MWTPVCQNLAVSMYIPGLGIRRTTDSVKYALRFKDVAALDSWAKTHGYEKHKWGRFKATSLRVSTGLKGTQETLAPLGWGGGGRGVPRLNPSCLPC